MKKLFMKAIALIIFAFTLAACSKTNSENNFTEPEKLSPNPPSSSKPSIERDDTVVSASNNNTAVSSEQVNEGSKASGNLFDCLSLETNRNSILLRAKNLNNGELHNACVYFVCEALRRINYKIPDSISNTTALIDILEKDGWKRSYTLSELKPGSICFTTDEKGGTGAPTHSYIFMNRDTSSKDTVYVCDNQTYDYDSVYHRRNLMFSYLNNDKNKPKEATLFFYYK